MRPQNWVPACAGTTKGESCGQQTRARFAPATVVMPANAGIQSGLSACCDLRTGSQRALGRRGGCAWATDQGPLCVLNRRHSSGRWNPDRPIRPLQPQNWVPACAGTTRGMRVGNRPGPALRPQPSSFQRTLESRSADPPAATSELGPSVRWDDEGGSRVDYRPGLALPPQRSSFQRTLVSRAAYPPGATSELGPSVRWDDEGGSRVDNRPGLALHPQPSSFQRTLVSRAAYPPGATSELGPSVRWDDEGGCLDNGPGLALPPQRSSFQRTLESRSAYPPVATSELGPCVRWNDGLLGQDYRQDMVAGSTAGKIICLVNLPIIVTLAPLPQATACSVSALSPRISISQDPSSLASDVNVRPA